MNQNQRELELSVHGIAGFTSRFPRRNKGQQYVKNAKSTLNSTTSLEGKSIKSKLHHKYNSRSRLEIREDVNITSDREAMEAAERIGASIEALGYDLSSNSYFSLSESESEDRYEPVSPTTSQIAEVNETYSASCFEKNSVDTDFIDHPVNEFNKQSCTERNMLPTPISNAVTGGTMCQFGGASTDYLYSYTTTVLASKDRASSMNSVTSDDFLSVVQLWEEPSITPKTDDTLEQEATSLTIPGLSPTQQTTKRPQRLRSKSTRDLNRIFLSDAQEQPIQSSVQDEQREAVPKEIASDNDLLVLEDPTQGQRRGKQMIRPYFRTKNDTVLKVQEETTSTSGVSSDDIPKTSIIPNEKGSFLLSKAKSNISKTNISITRRDTTKVSKSQACTSRWGSPRRTKPDKQYLLPNNTICSEHENGINAALAHEETTKNERTFPKKGLMMRFSDKASLQRTSYVDLSTKVEGCASVHIPPTVNTSVTPKPRANKSCNTLIHEVVKPDALTTSVVMTPNVFVYKGETKLVSTGMSANELNTQTVQSEVVINSVTRESLNFSSHEDLSFDTKLVQETNDKMSFMKRSKRGFKRFTKSTTKATMGSIKNILGSSVKGKEDASLSRDLKESEPTPYLADEVETCLTPTEKLIDTKPPKFISKKPKNRGPYIKAAPLILLPSIGEVIENNSSEKVENAKTSNIDFNDVNQGNSLSLFESHTDQDAVETELIRRNKGAAISEEARDLVDNDTLSKSDIFDDISLSNGLQSSRATNKPNIPASWLKCFANASIDRDTDDVVRSEKAFVDETSEDEDEEKADIHEQQQTSFICCGFGTPRRTNDKDHGHEVDLDTESSKSQSTFDNDEFEEVVQAVRTLSLTYPRNEIGSIATLGQEDDISVSDEMYGSINKAVAVIKRHAALYEVTEEELVSALAYRAEQQESDDWMMEVGEATDDFFDKVGNYLRIQGR
jgi:hypothetical protein